MDELVKLVVEKTGLPEDKARAATEVVLDYVKKRLPAPVAAQVDSAIKGGGADGVVKGLGGMLRR